MEMGPILARGRTAEVYEWSDGRVIKLFYDWCGEEWAPHEARCAGFAAGSGLPVPKFHETITVDGRRGIVYERADGPTLLGMLSAKPWAIGDQARFFADLHARVHGVSGTGLDDMTESLRATISNAPKIDDDAKCAAIAVLDRLPRGDALCHLDYHPDQIVLTKDGPRIIDWITAKRGNPLADVARTVILLSFGYPPDAGPLGKLFIDAARGRLRAAYLRRYLTGRPASDRAELDRWLIPLAAARLGDNIGEGDDALVRFLLRAIKRNSGA